MSKPRLPGEQKKYLTKYPPLRCVHRDCMFTGVSARSTNPENHGCNYMAITGHSRIAQLPEDQRDPAVCPFYKPGKQIRMRNSFEGERYK